MRCSEGQLGCGKRFTLSRAPHQYARGPFCPNCKSIHCHSVERAAVAQAKRRKKRGLICTCDNYPFPHVRATLRFCHQHPRITKNPSEREWMAYQAILDTPRGTYA